MYYLKKTQLGVELIFYQEKSPVGQHTDPTRTRLYELEAAQRAKRTIIDIGISNQWTHMFTITLKNNRYDYELQKNKLLKHFENYKQNHDHNLKYLLIPETHKDGALHFHGLIKITDKHLIFKKQRNQAYIYEHSIISQSFGFNEFTLIYNHQEFITYYIAKYITKSINTTLTEKRYYRSKNLEQPKKLYLDRRLDHWQDVMDLTSVVPTYQGQFATKWRFTTAEMVHAFRHNKRIREFLKN
jgi:hypothetical protein